MLPALQNVLRFIWIILNIMIKKNFCRCGKIKIETAKSSFSEWESDIEIQIHSPIWVDYVRKARDPTSIAYHDNRSVDKLRY